MKEMILQRHIPAGGINPNTNTTYINLEEVIRNTLEVYNSMKAKIPVVTEYAVTRSNKIGSFIITDIVGFVNYIDEENVSINFIDDNFAYICKDYHVAFAITAQTEVKGILVDSIRAIYLIAPTVDMDGIIES